MPAGRAPLATVLRSERILTATGVVCGEVRIVSGRIEAVVARPAGRGGEPTVHEAHGPRGDATVDELPGPRGDAIDLGRRWIVPGFIDTHVHGGGGAQLP